MAKRIILAFNGHIIFSGCTLKPRSLSIDEVEYLTGENEDAIAYADEGHAEVFRFLRELLGLEFSIPPVKPDVRVSVDHFIIIGIQGEPPTSVPRVYTAQELDQAIFTFTLWS